LVVTTKKASVSAYTPVPPTGMRSSTVVTFVVTAESLVTR
jgi:hypothetical protein